MGIYICAQEISKCAEEEISEENTLMDWWGKWAVGQLGQLRDLSAQPMYCCVCAPVCGNIFTSSVLVCMNMETGTKDISNEDLQDLLAFSFFCVCVFFLAEI